MRLDRLLGAVGVREVPPGSAGVEVTSVTHDSRAAGPGALFCCVPGASADGHDFAARAVGAGAVALVVERPVAPAVPQVLVPSVRQAMGPLAAALYGHPSHCLQVVGVTGTNGKTTTTWLLRAVLEADGRATAVLGTLSGPRTTPEAPELQRRLAELRDEGVRAVAMEVSSHALSLHRVDAVRFAVGVFTNMSQDHLDFHGTMEAYFEAKASLFTADRVQSAVVNGDDAWGRRLLERMSATGVPTRTFAAGDAADLRLAAGGNGAGTAGGGSTFRWRGAPVTLRLGGAFNVANALAAATAAEALGVPPATVAEGLSSVEGVPGRFEIVSAGRPFAVVVDYAHTPAALEQALAAARGLAAPGTGRVLAVFGCGGQRDGAKRPVMGEVATRLADRAWLTSDNPRSEDPLAIIAQVRAGVRSPERLVVEPDRASAIAMAIGDAGPGDVVLIAGKGHEQGQDVAGVVSPFDDRAVARAALEQR